jgi:hypothetical protein
MEEVAFQAIGLFSYTPDDNRSPFATEGRSHMKKPMAVDALVVSVSMASMAMLGSGVATADDYSGETYADAAAAISSSKGTPVMASRIGDTVPQDQCVVTRSQKVADGNKVLLYLNCNATMASATDPGYSAASPEYRAAQKKQSSVEWKRTPEGQQWCKWADKVHPEWKIMNQEGCKPES